MMNEVDSTNDSRARRRYYRGGLFWPVILILIGVLFLLKNFNLLTGDVGGTLLQLWPVLLILIGLDSLFQRHGLAGPVFLIGLGTVFLLNNFGHLPWNAWDLILSLWPILIIAIGLDIIIGRRSVWGALLSLVLMLAIVAGALLLMGVGSSTNEDVINWSPTANISHLDVTLNPAIGSLLVGNLQGGTSLAEGTLYLQRGENVNKQMTANGTFSIKSEGNIFFTSVGKSTKWKWDLNLTPNVPMSFDVNMGVGEMNANLQNLQVDRFDVSLGVGKITLAVGKQALNGKVNCAVGETVLLLPPGVEAQITLKAGITAVDMPAGFTHSGDVYTSAGYGNTNAIRANIEVDQAIGNVRVEYQK